MSKNYSTSATFHSYNNDARVREIVQEELYEFFSDIKDEIQNKIKTIDVNICQLKLKIDKANQKLDLSLNSLTQGLKDVERKIQKVKEEKNQQMLQILNMSSRSRSFEKQKTNLFRKSSSAMDLSKILFGQQKQKEREKEYEEQRTTKVKEREERSPKKKVQAKPPLPKAKIDKVEEVKTEKRQNNINRGNEVEETVEKSESLIMNLNKNKNSFMRKKSEKKLQTFTIEEEQVEQSVIRNSNE